MLIDRGVVIAGMEIEVPVWEDRTYTNVAEELIDAGYMLPPLVQWKSHHKYHCNCEAGGCYYVRKGTVSDPPLVSLTYDASLPKQGGEFIVSPVPLSGVNRGREMLKDIWSIVVRDAVWADDITNYHDDGKCSPSVHLHVSANLKGTESPIDIQLYNKDFVMDGFSLFAPEFYALADVTEFRRKINYRWPNRYSMMTFDSSETPMHHGFVDVRKVVPNVQSYIEWRLFEAAYNDWDYIEASLWMAAAVTRGMLDTSFFKEFMGIGFSNPYDDFAMNEYAGNLDFEAILSLFDEHRFYALRDLVLTNLDDEPDGRNMVVDLFEKVEERML